MKAKTTSLRIKDVTRYKIKRFFGLGLREFIEIALDLIENNDYVKNKFKERLGK